jgi:hypothetical protein
LLSRGEATGQFCLKAQVSCNYFWVNGVQSTDEPRRCGIRNWYGIFVLKRVKTGIANMVRMEFTLHSRGRPKKFGLNTKKVCVPFLVLRAAMRRLDLSAVEADWLRRAS